MNAKLQKFELESALRRDAEEITTSRHNSRLMHTINDIDAAGDEVEQKVRDLIRRRLSSMYYVGHGHILDSDLTTSPQLDIIIADKTGSPSLFKAQNGSEYFPYESVYAIGEVKSTYYRSKRYIHTFIETTTFVKQNLKRDFANTRENDLMHSFVGNRIITRKIPYRNPLLTFMFFVNCNDFNLSDIQDIYNSNANNKANLPNIICFLDKGVVVNTHHSRAESFHHLHDISLIPEFNIEYQNDPSQWILIPFENLGASWFYLVIMLSGHLRQSVLTQPDLSKYLSNLLTWDRNHIQRM